MNSKEVKTFCKQFDSAVRVSTITGTHNKQKYDAYIQAWGNFTDYIELRRIALRAIYGHDFNGGDRALAGNVRENCISMSPTQWAQVVRDFTANIE